MNYIIYNEMNSVINHHHYYIIDKLLIVAYTLIPKNGPLSFITAPQSQLIFIYVA